MRFDSDEWIGLLSSEHRPSEESVIYCGRVRKSLRVTKDVWNQYFEGCGGVGLVPGAEIEIRPTAAGGSRIAIPGWALERLALDRDSTVCITHRRARFFLKKLTVSKRPTDIPGWIVMDSFGDAEVSRTYTDNPQVDGIDRSQLQLWLSQMGTFRFDPVASFQHMDGIVGLLGRKMLHGELSAQDTEAEARYCEQILTEQQEDGSWDGAVMKTAARVIRLLELGMVPEDAALCRAVSWLVGLPEPEGLPGLFMFSRQLTERFNQWKVKPGAKGRPHRRESKGEREGFQSSVDFTINYANDPCELRLTWTSSLVLEALLRCGLADHRRVLRALNTVASLSGNGGWCGCGYLDAKWQVAASDDAVDLNRFLLPSKNSAHHVDWFPEPRDILSPTCDGGYESLVVGDRSSVLVKSWHNTGLCSMVMYRALSYHPAFPGSRLEAYGALRLAYLQSSVGTWGRQVFLSSMLGFLGRSTHPLAAFLALRSVPLLIRRQGEDGFWQEEPIDRKGQRWPVPTREESTFMILRALRALGFLDTLLPRGV